MDQVGISLSWSVLSDITCIANRIKNKRKETPYKELGNIRRSA